ncbi:MAG: phosphatidylserine decarboxylase family protein [Flavobacteriales bacterium AspAUS03]
MIHKEGYVILGSAFVWIILFVLLGFYILTRPLAVMLMILSMLLYGFLLWFFRNPVRRFIIADQMVVAPVDGKVVIIERVFEPEFLKANCIQIAIFMSPLNVHVTRYPVSGDVIYSKYHPGKYLVAWHPKSSTKNERTTVAVETRNTDKIVFRQIAGFLARRIVLYTKKGCKARIGEEFGFIKFGSRVDVFLPLNTKILVELNQKTIGGKTVIASLV